MEFYLLEILSQTSFPVLSHGQQMYLLLHFGMILMSEMVDKFYLDSLTTKHFLTKLEPPLMMLLMMTYSTQHSYSLPLGIGFLSSTEIQA